MQTLRLIEADDDLVPLLRGAPDDMLDPLVGYLTDDGQGRLAGQLSGTAAFQKHHPAHGRYADEIAAELQKFGGNTLANVARLGRGVRYAEIARDVAGKLGVDLGSDAPLALVEERVLFKILEQAWPRMDDRERHELLDTIGAEYSGALPQALPLAVLQVAIQASGFAFYKLALVVANGVARAVLGRGLTLAANAALSRSIAIATGPIGWAVTALWTAVDLAGPAFRVTIPCVVQVATIRLLAEQERTTSWCPAGHANPMLARFCNECGATLTPPAAT